MKLIAALNALHSNYLMLAVLGAGIGLVLHGHESIGSNLVVGSFAILRSTASAAPAVPNDPPKS